jgi:hypothetical protein
MAHGTCGTAAVDAALSWVESLIKGGRRTDVMDRVAIVALAWFVGWITAATELFKYLLNDPGTGVILGFTLALLTVFAWPWILPHRLECWMHDPPTAE